MVIVIHIVTSCMHAFIPAVRRARSGHILRACPFIPDLHVYSYKKPCFLEKMARTCNRREEQRGWIEGGVGLIGDVKRSQRHGDGYDEGENKDGRV